MFISNICLPAGLPTSLSSTTLQSPSQDADDDTFEQQTFTNEEIKLRTIKFVENIQMVMFQMVSGQGRRVESLMNISKYQAGFD